jgi:uncharacterized membrane protein
MLNAVQFSTSPGTSLTIPITLLNRGLEGDAFILAVEGLPEGWASISAPVTPLEPGENKVVSFIIQPPLSPTSQAGRSKFIISVASQQNPEQGVRVECVLTVAAYAQVSVQLQLPETKAGSRSA